MATFRLADIDSHGVHRLFIVVGVAVSATLRGLASPAAILYSPYRVASGSGISVIRILIIEDY